MLRSDSRRLIFFLCFAVNDGAKEGKDWRSARWLFKGPGLARGHTYRLSDDDLKHPPTKVVYSCNA